MTKLQTGPFNVEDLQTSDPFPSHSKTFDKCMIKGSWKQHFPPFLQQGCEIRDRDITGQVTGCGLIGF